MRAFLEPVVDVDRTSEVGDSFGESLSRFTYGDRGGYSQTSLSGATEGAVVDYLGGHFHVGVGQHDYVVLGSALCLYSLSVGGSTRVNIPGRRGRADKTDCSNQVMIEEGVHRGLAPVNQVDHALRQTEFIDQLKQTLHG